MSPLKGLLAKLGPKLSASELEQLLAEGGSRNLSHMGYDAYMHAGPRSINGMMQPNVLGLANFTRKGVEENVHTLPVEARPQGGKLTSFLEDLATKGTRAGKDFLYVENVVNEFLPEALKRRAFLPDDLANLTTPMAPSFYKPLTRRAWEQTFSNQEAVNRLLQGLK